MKSKLQIRNPKSLLKFSISALFLITILLFNSSYLQAQNPNSNVNGGIISTDDNTTICIDGISDIVNVNLEGASGREMQWIITDNNNNILALPDSPPFDFDGAGVGVCRIWHLSYNGIRPFKHVQNLNDLRGRYDLSNYIEITRQQSIGGTLEGGSFEFCVGDGVADHIPDGAITLSGNSGSNSQWIITDIDGNILGLPPTPYAVNFDGAPAGVCLVWHLSYEDGLSGLDAGQNISALDGCYSLSNSVSVVRTHAEGGTLEGGPFEFCVGDGVADHIPDGAITLSGNSGSNSQWIITDIDGNILGLPPTPSAVNFDGAPAGVCLVWHLSYEDVEGLAPGENISAFSGCYSLSNSVSVVRTHSEGGTLEGGPFEFCVGDGVADHIPDGAITLSGNSGSNSQWIITDIDGNILGLPPTPSAVNFDGAPAGVCLVWHLSYEDVEGLAPGENISAFSGCYSLSNSVSVVRTHSEGGTLEGGPFEFTVGDGVADHIADGAITLSGNSGSNSQWIITDIDGNILGLPPTPYVVDFDGAPAGECLVWHLSYEDVEGLDPGLKVLDLEGCYSLSNSLSVIRTEVPSRISFYPNPASQVVNLVLPNIKNESYRVVIYNMQNIVVASEVYNSRSSFGNNVSLNVSHLLKGTYFMSIENEGNKNRIMKKLIIN